MCVCLGAPEAEVLASLRLILLRMQRQRDICTSNKLIFRLLIRPGHRSRVTVPSSSSRSQSTARSPTLMPGIAALLISRTFFVRSLNVIATKNV